MKNQSITVYTVVALLLLMPILYFKTYVKGMPISAEVILIPLLLAAAYFDYRKGNITLNNLRIKPIVYGFGAFALVAVVSFVKAEALKPSVLELARYVSYALMFIVLYKINFSKEQYKLFLKALIASVTLTGLFGVVQFFFNYSLNTAGIYAMPGVKGRVDSTLINPNYYAAFLNLFLPISLLLASSYFKEKKATLLTFAFFSLLLINLVLTYTRAATLVLVICLALVFCFIPKTFFKGLIRPTVLIAMILLLVVVNLLPGVANRTYSGVIGVVQVVAPNAFKADPNKADVKKPEEKALELNTERAVNSRLTLWKTGLKMFQENPVLGVGIGNYYVRYNDYVKKYPELNIGVESYSVHNSYIKVLAETGVIGLLAFLAIYVVLVIKLLGWYFRRTQWIDKLVGLGVLFGALSYMMQNFSNNLIFIPQLNTVFWAAAALVLGYLFANRTDAVDQKA